MSLIFYYAPQSSASPIHWTLEELGAPYEKVAIDLKAQQQKSAEFLKINPNGKVPVLVHDGAVIFESAAIQMYLGETFGVEKGLYPAPGVARGEAMKWIVWTNVTLGEALWRFGRNVGDWAPADERNEKAGQSAKADVEKLLLLVDQALVGKEYLVEGRFSLADLHLSSWMDYVRMMSFDLTPYPTLSAWVARCIARPAYQLAP